MVFSASTTCVSTFSVCYRYLLLLVLCLFQSIISLYLFLDLTILIICRQFWPFSTSVFHIFCLLSFPCSCFSIFSLYLFVLISLWLVFTSFSISLFWSFVVYLCPFLLLLCSTWLSLLVSVLIIYSSFIPHLVSFILANKKTP